MDKGSREKFKAKYDIVLLALNFTGYAQTNEVRITWSTDHSVDQPWYFAEIPTVVVSLNYTKRSWTIWLGMIRGSCLGD